MFDDRLAQLAYEALQVVGCLERILALIKHAPEGKLSTLNFFHVINVESKQLVKTNLGRKGTHVGLNLDPG